MVNHCTACTASADFILYLLICILTAQCVAITTELLAQSAKSNIRFTGSRVVPVGITSASESSARFCFSNNGYISVQPLGSTSELLVSMPFRCIDLVALAPIPSITFDLIEFCSLMWCRDGRTSQSALSARLALMSALPLQYSCYPQLYSVDKPMILCFVLWYDLTGLKTPATSLSFTRIKLRSA